MTEENKTKDQTLGEFIVGGSFNPSGKPEIDAIKTQTAALIDLLAEQMGDLDIKAQPWMYRAIDQIEIGCMLAVKAQAKSYE